MYPSLGVWRLRGGSRILARVSYPRLLRQESGRGYEGLGISHLRFRLAFTPGPE